MTPRPDPAWSAPRQHPGDDHAAGVTALDGAVLVLWSLLGQLVVGLGLALAGVRQLVGPGLVAAGLLGQSLVLTGTLAWLVGRRALTWRLLGPRRPRLADLGTGVVVGVLGAVVTATTVLVGSLVTDVAPAEQALLREALGGDTLTVVLAAVAAVVLAPLVEELIFRGVLFQALGRRLGLVAGAALSGVVFALVHLELTEPTYVVALALLGTLFALALHRSRSLVVPVVAHATFNALQLVLALTIAG